MKVQSDGLTSNTYFVDGDTAHEGDKGSLFVMASVTYAGEVLVSVSRGREDNEDFATDHTQTYLNTDEAVEFATALLRAVEDAKHNAKVVMSM